MYVCIVYSISHDLNSKLSFAGMYIVMLMNSSGDDEYCMHGNHMTGFTTTWDY